MKDIFPSESNRLAYPPIPVPARISHQLFAAAGDAPHPAIFSHLGVLDVPSSTTPRPSDRKRHWARHLAALASKSGEICGLGLLALLLVAAGCATVGGSTPASDIERLPVEAKDRVHVIFVNSPLDVLQIGRLAGVASYFRSRGFQHSGFQYLSSGPKLAGEVRDLHLEDDGARIALVAWSGASLWVWDALKELDETGERVNLIVYLDSNWIKKRVASAPMSPVMWWFRAKLVNEWTPTSAAGFLASIALLCAILAAPIMVACRRCPLTFQRARLPSGSSSCLSSWPWR